MKTHRGGGGSDRTELGAFWNKEGRLNGYFEKLRDEASLERSTGFHFCFG